VAVRHPRRPTAASIVGCWSLAKTSRSQAANIRGIPGFDKPETWGTRHPAVVVSVPLNSGDATKWECRRKAQGGGCPSCASSAKTRCVVGCWSLVIGKDRKISSCKHSWNPRSRKARNLGHPAVVVSVPLNPGDTTKWECRREAKGVCSSLVVRDATVRRRSLIVGRWQRHQDLKLQIIRGIPGFEKRETWGTRPKAPYPRHGPCVLERVCF
jgi:hypothetical protein